AYVRKQIAVAKDKLARVTARRNAVAAAVVVHWGWPVEPVRRIVGTGRDRILAAEPAAKRYDLDRRLTELSIQARDLRNRIADLAEAQRQAMIQAPERPAVPTDEV